MVRFTRAALLTAIMACCWAGAAMADSTTTGLNSGGTIQTQDLIPIARPSQPGTNLKVTVGPIAPLGIGTGLASSGGNLTLNTAQANSWSALQTFLSGDMTAADPVFTGGSLLLPSGTTVQRPGSGVNGMIRYNSDVTALEAFVNGAWGPVVSPPTTSALGGVLAKASSVAHQVVQYIDTSGVQHLLQLGFSDLAGSVGSTQMPALSGDVASSAGSTATTLATVNSNVGTFQGLTINGKGLVTGASNQSYAPLNSPVLTGSPKINLNASSLPAGQTGTVFQMGNADSTASRIEIDSFGATAYVSGIRADGTNASKTAIQSAEEIVGYNAWGYNGTSTVGPRASFRTFASQNWTSSNNGTYADIAATPNNSTTMSEVASFTFNTAGLPLVGIGTNAPGAALDMSQVTDALALPSGTTGQRPSSPIAGMVRVNTTLSAVETYLSGAWQQLPVPTNNRAIQNLNNAQAIQEPFLRAALARVKNLGGNAKLCWIGDSTTFGVGGNGSLGGNEPIGSYPTQVAAALQAYGLPSSYQTFWADGSTAQGYGGNDSRATMGSSWTQASSTYATAAGYAYTASTTTNALSFKPTNAVDTFKVYYITNTGDGTFSVDVNGSGTTSQSANSAAGVASITITGTLGANNTLNIKYVSGGSVHIIGAEAYDSTRSVILMDNFGWAASSTTDWNVATNPWNPANTALWTALACDAVFINLGINDWNNGTAVSTFQSNLTAIASAISATASTDVVFITPVPSNPATHTVPQNTQVGYVGAIFAAAQSQSDNVVDFFDRLVSYSVSGSATLGYYYTDGVHLLQKGYLEEAQDIASFIVSNGNSGGVIIQNPVTTIESVIIPNQLNGIGVNGKDEIGRWNSGSGSQLILLGSRGTTVGAHSASQGGDTLGTFDFCGDDGTNFCPSATGQIKGVVTTTATSGIVSGGLTFSTQTTGGSLTPAMTISAAQGVAIGTSGVANTGTSLDLSNTTSSMLIPIGTTGQRPGSPTAGEIRYNSTLAQIEAYVGGVWNLVTGQANNNYNFLYNSRFFISQINGTNSVAVANTNTIVRPVDQYDVVVNNVNVSGVTAQIVVDAPTPDLPLALKVTIGTGSGTIPAGADIIIVPPIEGAEWASLGFGSANAKAFSSSCWVKSNISGSFGFVFANFNDSRGYTAVQTTTANTWTLAFVDNIPGDTTGTWNSTEGSIGAYGPHLVLQAGSTNQTSLVNQWNSSAFLGQTGSTTNYAATNGNSFEVTGCEVNPGPVHIPLPFVTFQEDFARAQRFLECFADTTGPLGSGAATSTTAAGFVIPFHQKMDVVPTLIAVPTVADLSIYNYANASVAALSGMTLGTASRDEAMVTTTVASGLTSGTPYQVRASTALQGNVCFDGRL